ncbi:MAG: hypothetical protein Q9220_000750 [cf. Caloplaca sp. 1 TL-2023]
MDAQPSIDFLLERISIVHQASKLSADGSMQLETRDELRGLIKEAGFALETPFDTMNRVVAFPIIYTTVRVGINLGLFEYLIEAGRAGRTIEDLAEKTNVDQDFLDTYVGLLPARLLRGLETTGFVTQLSERRWAATTCATACTIPGIKSGFKFIFDFMGPVFQKLPEFLAKNGHRCPTANDSPFQLAYHTKKQGFEHLMEPQWAEERKDCNLFMEGRRRGNTAWLESYPFAEEVLAGVIPEDDATALVDVGGGLGQALLEIKGKFPDLKGHLILQDLPNTVKQAGDGNGAFRPMGHDFFTPQPIKGARAYLLRQVLHDWPDQECRTILKHIAAAIKPGYSKLLIDEMVVLEIGASEKVIMRDIAMLGMSGGLERTERQWVSLLESAGLRIEKIWPVTGVEESIIEVVPM